MNRHFSKIKKFILASGSPRRKELIAKLGLPFGVEVSEADETVPEDMPVEAVPEYLSGLKAEAVSKLHEGEDVLIVGADTIVVLDGIIYGKPQDEKDAYHMLKTLSGRTHRVITGVTIISGDGDRRQQLSFSSVSEVTFYELSDDEIWSYIASGEPMDKAGAYGIQQGGALIVERINGDFYSVMGLPVARLARKIRELEF